MSASRRDFGHVHSDSIKSLKPEAKSHRSHQNRVGVPKSPAPATSVPCRMEPCRTVMQVDGPRAGCRRTGLEAWP